jgi:hypothetical protein
VKAKNLNFCGDRKSNIILLLFLCTFNKNKKGGDFFISRFLIVVILHKNMTEK